MNQKYFAKIFLIILAVALVGMFGYFALLKLATNPVELPIQPIAPLTNKTSSSDTQVQQNVDISTQTNRDYKIIISKSFDHGNGEQQFGVIRVAGGAGISSFSTDNRNYLYIADTLNNRVKILNSDGKQISTINTESLEDIAIDNHGNIYGYANSSGYPGDHLLKYSNDGSLLGTIENPPAFLEISSQNVFGRLYVIDNNLYITDNKQNSYLITSTTGSLKAETEKAKGIYGNSGKRYYISGNFISPEGVIVPVESRKGFVDILNQFGNKERVITIELNGLERLETISFLGEDRNGNIYIQTETSDKSGINVQVRKYDSVGSLLTVLDVPTSTVWAVKLIHVDWTTGDIWQVAHGVANLLVKRWSTIY